MSKKHHGMKEKMQHVLGGHTHKTKEEEFQDEVDGPLPDLEDLMTASLPTKLHTMKVMQARMLQNQKAEPTIQFVKALAAAPLKSHHGEVTAMGVPRADLPHWDSIQFVVSQMAKKPLMDFDKVDTTTIIGPNAKKPLVLKIPLFVSDMSYGAISEEAKMALARGAELAGTGICSGEGGMLPTEKAENSRYLYELASGRFGWDMDEIPAIVQAFHFKVRTTAQCCRIKLTLGETDCVVVSAPTLSMLTQPSTTPFCFRTGWSRCQDRHRWTFAWQQGRGQDRQGAQAQTRIRCHFASNLHRERPSDTKRLQTLC